MSVNYDDIYVIEPGGTRICEIRNLRNGEQVFFRVKGNVSLVDFFGPEDRDTTIFSIFRLRKAK